MLKKYVAYLMFPLSMGLPLTRGNVMDAVNVQRSNVGLPAVVNDIMLNIAATAKAKEMARTDTFAHYVKATATFQYVNSTGYKYKSAGEVLAAKFDDPRDVAQAWIDSRTHKAVILGNFSRAGVGIACSSWVVANEPLNTCYTVMEFVDPM